MRGNRTLKCILENHIQGCVCMFLNSQANQIRCKMQGICLTLTYISILKLGYSSTAPRPPADESIHPEFYFNSYFYNIERNQVSQYAYQRSSPIGPLPVLLVQCIPGMHSVVQFPAVRGASVISFTIYFERLKVSI